MFNLFGMSDQTDRFITPDGTSPATGFPGAILEYERTGEPTVDGLLVAKGRLLTGWGGLNIHVLPDPDAPDSAAKVGLRATWEQLTGKRVAVPASLVSLDAPADPDSHYVICGRVAVRGGYAVFSVAADGFAPSLKTAASFSDITARELQVFTAALRSTVAGCAHGLGFALMPGTSAQHDGPPHAFTFGVLIEGLGLNGPLSCLRNVHVQRGFMRLIRKVVIAHAELDGWSSAIRGVHPGVSDTIGFLGDIPPDKLEVLLQDAGERMSLSW